MTVYITTEYTLCTSQRNVPWVYHNGVYTVSIHETTFVCCRIKQVVCFGEGAGAHILGWFAVSLVCNALAVGNRFCYSDSN